MKFVLPFLAIALLLTACGMVEPPADQGTAGTTGGAETDSGDGATSGVVEDTAVEDSGTADSGDTEAEDSGTTETGVYSNGTATGGVGTGDTGATETQTTVKNKEIFYESGGWRIYGTLYESVSKTPTKTIILVHEFDKNRSVWPISFIEKLHSQFPEAMVLAIDLRGHGKSTNMGTWEKFDMATYKDMKTDIISADKYIGTNYPTADEYYVVGASLGSTAAILAGAQEKTINKVVMISPGMGYKGVDISRAAEDYVHDVLAVAANGDAYSASAVGEIDALRNVEYTEVMIYPGSEHGTELFAATAGGSAPLDQKIVDFLK